mgnify:CR=1 FL=1
MAMIEIKSKESVNVLWMAMIEMESKKSVNVL